MAGTLLGAGRGRFPQKVLDTDYKAATVGGNQTNGLTRSFNHSAEPFGHFLLSIVARR